MPQLLHSRESKLDNAKLQEHKLINRNKIPTIERLNCFMLKLSFTITTYGILVIS
jgi:hypothetical protein